VFQELRPLDHGRPGHLDGGPHQRSDFKQSPNLNDQNFKQKHRMDKLNKSGLFRLVRKTHPTSAEMLIFLSIVQHRRHLFVI
jgi:hypothetical protein